MKSQVDFVEGSGKYDPFIEAVSRPGEKI